MNKKILFLTTAFILIAFSIIVAIFFSPIQINLYKEFKEGRYISKTISGDQKNIALVFVSDPGAAGPVLYTVAVGRYVNGYIAFYKVFTQSDFPPPIEWKSNGNLLVKNGAGKIYLQKGNWRDKVIEYLDYPYQTDHIAHVLSVSNSLDCDYAVFIVEETSANDIVGKPVFMDYRIYIAQIDKAPEVDEVLKGEELGRLQESGLIFISDTIFSAEWLREKTILIHNREQKYYYGYKGLSLHLTAEGITVEFDHGFEKWY